jgi:hypothetical protein
MNCTHITHSIEPQQDHSKNHLITPQSRDKIPLPTITTPSEPSIHHEANNQTPHPFVFFGKPTVQHTTSMHQMLGINHVHAYNQ